MPLLCSFYAIALFWFWSWCFLMALHFFVILSSLPCSCDLLTSLQCYYLREGSACKHMIICGICVTLCLCLPWLVSATFCLSALYDVGVHIMFKFERLMVKRDHESCCCLLSSRWCPEATAWSSLSFTTRVDFRHHSKIKKHTESRLNKYNKRPCKQPAAARKASTNGTTTRLLPQ